MLAEFVQTHPAHAPHILERGADFGFAIKTDDRPFRDVTELNAPAM